MQSIFTFIVTLTVAGMANAAIDFNPKLSHLDLSCSNHATDVPPAAGAFDVRIKHDRKATLSIWTRNQDDAVLHTVRMRCSVPEVGAERPPCCDQMGVSLTCTGHLGQGDARRTWTLVVRSGGFAFHNSVTIWEGDTKKGEIPWCNGK